jgi:hypothetical protein
MVGCRANTLFLVEKFKHPYEPTRRLKEAHRETSVLNVTKRKTNC